MAPSGRTLRTTVAIKNLGAELPFTWFPHPFFPHVGPPREDELCPFTPAATSVDGRQAEPGFSHDPPRRLLSPPLELPGSGPPPVPPQPPRRLHQSRRVSWST